MLFFVSKLNLNKQKIYDFKKRKQVTLDQEEGPPLREGLVAPRARFSTFPALGWPACHLSLMGEDTGCPWDRKGTGAQGGRADPVPSPQ